MISLPSFAVVSSRVFLLMHVLVVSLIADVVEASTADNNYCSDGCTCFETNEELRAAIIQFMSDGCSDKNNCNNNVVKKYGWPIGTWCVQGVQDMSRLFQARYFWSDDGPPKYFRDDISGWDVSQVTNMRSMFFGAKSFQNDLSSWNVSSVENFSFMFNYAAFNGNVSGWDLSSAKEMRYMFADSKFNRDLSTWDVSSVSNMESMFSRNNKFNQDLSSWNISNVMVVEDMFNECRAFNQDLCSWGDKLSNQITRRSMFWNSGCRYTSDPSRNSEEVGPFCARTCKETCFRSRDELKGAIEAYGMQDIPNEDILSKYGYLEFWCFIGVTDMSFLFANQTNFNRDISKWDVSSVENMEGMFQGASDFNQDLSDWDISKVSNAEGMFEGAISLETSTICDWGNGWREFVVCPTTNSGSTTSAVGRVLSSVLLVKLLFCYFQ